MSEVSYRILGIDPGSRFCGYGVIDYTPHAPRARATSSKAWSEITYVECGVLTAPESQPMETRVGLIAAQLTEVVQDLRPHVVALEDVFAKVNVKSALALAQARGMVLAVVGMAGLQVHSYPPATVKKTVAGNGRAEKSQVAKLIQMILGLQKVPEADAADALSVAIAFTRLHHTGVDVRSAVKKST